MTDISIPEAIQLFEFSSTAQIGESAGKVVKELWRLFKAGEIGYKDQRSDTTRGSWLANRRGYDLQVNPGYINSLHDRQRLAAVSLELVHEGCHAALNYDDDLIDEMGARKLQIRYYLELSGPGVFNEASDTPVRGRRTEIVTLPPNSFAEYQKESAWMKADRLIDYVLTRKVYTKPRYLNPYWVATNLELWGGPKNRLPETKGLYIKTLVTSFDPFFAPAIIELMQSVETRADWDTMMANAGSLRTIRIALDGLIPDKTRTQQIVDLQRKWNVVLSEEP